MGLAGLLPGSPASGGTSEATLAAESGLHTAYLDLRIKEYRLPIPLRGVGGAVAVVGEMLVLASADGRFLRIEPRKMQYLADFLPALALGADDIDKSKRIKQRELLPRVHDLVQHGGRYYVSHDVYSRKDDCIYFTISSIPVSGGTWSVVYQAPSLDVPHYTLGTGGRLAISEREGRLYFTVGDYSLDRFNRLPSDVAAQNPMLPWGKINYLDLKDHSVHMHTLGHCNPQGLVILDDGRMLASEHGPQGGDEINLIKAGRNYGWPYRSYGTEYGSFLEYRRLLPPPKTTDFTEPLFSFVPSVAPTQLIQVSNFHKKWNGDLLMGSLRAMTLFHIKLADDRVVFSEPIPIKHRIRDIKQWHDRFILLTDDCTLLVMTWDKGAPGGK